MIFKTSKPQIFTFVCPLLRAAKSRDRRDRWDRVTQITGRVDGPEIKQPAVTAGARKMSVPRTGGKRTDPPPRFTAGTRWLPGCVAEGDAQERWPLFVRMRQNLHLCSVGSVVDGQRKDFV